MGEIVTDKMMVRKDGNKISASFIDTTKIDGINANLIRQHLIRVISKRGIHLELDMSGIHSIDTDGYDALNLIYRLGKKYGSVITLKGVEADLLEMINLVKKYHVFYIHQIKPAC